MGRGWVFPEELEMSIMKLIMYGLAAFEIYVQGGE